MNVLNMLYVLVLVLKYFFYLSDSGNTFEVTHTQNSSTGQEVRYFYQASIVTCRIDFEETQRRPPFPTLPSPNNNAIVLRRSR